MFLCQKQTHWSRWQADSRLLTACFAVNLENHGHVSANVDALVLVPDEACELKFGVLIPVFDEGQTLMLVDLVVMITLLLTCLILTTVAAFYGDTFKPLDHGVEIYGI
jgi:hypothetical protein